MTDWTCPACGRRFARRGQSHACGRFTVEDVFADPAGQAIVGAVGQKLPGAHQEQTRTQVGFRNRTRFAWLWRPPAAITARLPRGAVVLSFCLPDRVDSQRLREVTEPRPGRFVHHVVLAGPDDVDDEVAAWLAQAFLAAG